MMFVVRLRSAWLAAAIVTSTLAMACQSRNGGAAGDASHRPFDTKIEAPPKGVTRVNLTVSAEAMARLDADLFHAPDEIGLVTIDGVSYSEVDVNYRGAWTLLDVQALGLRNWKVKFKKALPYRNRREWNFNYEPNLKQRLALDLMDANGVKVSSAEHVILSLNGVYQGIYLQYEDPDNDDWLMEKFGDSTGDLYKAANYTPGDPIKIYSSMEPVDPQDPALSQHYNKKTNKDTDPIDYASLFAFLDGLNGTSDGDLHDWLDHNFDVEGFLRYLVVANFISNWDSHPVRAKNFWLYQNRRTHQMVYIPWDLNEVLTDKNPAVDLGFNQMGIDCPLFFNMPSGDYSPMSGQEPLARPLTDRMMKEQEYRNAYVARYREAMQSVFVLEKLQRRVDELAAFIRAEASSSDQEKLDVSAETIKRYLSDRHHAVTDQLTRL